MYIHMYIYIYIYIHTYSYILHMISTILLSDCLQIWGWHGVAIVKARAADRYEESMATRPNPVEACYAQRLYKHETSTLYIYIYIHTYIHRHRLYTVV